MKEPYEEGIANHLDPEPCGVPREGGGEASVGACAGRTLSCERSRFQGADAVAKSGRPHPRHREREMFEDPAQSETPGTHRNSLHGSREIPRLASADSAEVRTVNPMGARRR